ncbi:MAG: hypothetical protein JOZ22_13060 [Acidobacteriia bacterium]|nr:hypothetical protein [Terriglobia bacterium]
MVRRQIELDEESDQLLNQFAQEYGGDAGRAVRELLHSRQRVEEFVDFCEAAHADILLEQKQRAEGGARETFTAWEEIKRLHNL